MSDSFDQRAKTHPDDVSSAGRPTVQRRLNVRLLIATLVLLAVATPAVYFAWATQLRRSAETLLDRATVCEEESRWGDAVRYLQQYALLRPDENEVHVRIAKDFDRLVRNASSRRSAIKLFYRAVGIEQKDVELRQRLLELLVLERQWDAAETQIDALKKQGPNAVRAAKRTEAMIEVERAVGNDAVALRKARATLESVHASYPDDVQIAFSLSMLYREHGEKLGLSAKDAALKGDATMDAMIEKNPQNDDAFLRRFAYRQRFQHNGAKDDIEKALRLGPKNPVVLLAAGDYFLSPAAGVVDAARARECYEQVTKIVPEAEIAYVGWGLALMAAGDSTAAVEAWKTGLHRIGDDSIPLNHELFQYFVSQAERDRKNTALRQNNLAEADKVLKRISKAIETLAPTMPSEARASQRRFGKRLEAQLALAGGNTNLAIPLLKGSLEGTQDGNGLDAMRERGVLAQAYAAIECWDLAAAELETLATSQPNRHERQTIAAEAWRRAGRLDRAIVALRRATQIVDAPAMVWVQLAEAELDRQLSIPSRAARNWDAFRQAAAQAKAKQPDAWQVRLLQVNYLIAQGNDASKRDAIALLRGGEKAHAGEAAYWRRLPLLYERLAQPVAADQALRGLAAVDKDPSSAVLVAVDLLTARKQFDAADARLRDAIASAAPDSRQMLRERRIQLAVDFDHADVARREVDALIEGDNRAVNIRLLRQGADLAVAAKDVAAATRYEERMRAAEGDSGTIWRVYRARRLLTIQETPSATDVKDAQRELSRILAERPTWAPAMLLSAYSHELSGRADAAIELYQRAIEQGEGGVVAYEHLAMLLFAGNRLTEAQALLDRMAAGGATSSSLDALTIEMYARQDKADRALVVAKQAVAKDPKNAMRRVWLGNVLALTDDHDAALAQFREGLKLAPNDLRVWNALFTFHRRAGHLAEAEKTLVEMSGRTDLTAAQKASVLGQGYQLLGKPADAERLLLEASRLAPNDVAILSRLAAFQVDTNVTAAMATLEKILTIDPQSHLARRTLATLMATTQGEDGWQAAQKLLGRSDAAGGSPVDNDRLRALLLARRRGDKEQRRKAYIEAREILDARLSDGREPEALDRQILAEISEGEASLAGDPRGYEAARAQLRPLVDRATPTENHLQLYLATSLRYASNPAFAARPDWKRTQAELWTDAERRLARLEQIERDGGRFPSSASFNLRIGWLRAIGRGSEIASLVESRAADRLNTLKDPQERSGWMSFIGRIYAANSEATSAERWFRQAYVESPRNFAPLAAHLSQHGRLAEAIDLCQQAIKTDQTSAAATYLLQLVVGGQPKAADFKRIEAEIVAAERRHPSDVNLLFAIALVRTIAGQTDDAIRMYERVVKLESRHVLAMNNLATLLADRADRRADALRYCERAMQISGRQPLLLDTQGTIHLMQGDAAKAVAALVEAVELNGDDPRYWFHLAAAYHREGQLEKARAAFDRAMQNGLDRQVLTAGDAQLRKELEKAF